MNKADYIALINSKLPDGTQLPSSDHRSTMHTNANSIIEVVYGDSIEETKATESILTTPSADWDFKVSIMKVGRQVTIIGSFINDSSSPISPIINIVNPDYKCKEDISFYGIGLLSNQSVTITVQNITTPLTLSRMNLGTILLPNESIDFNITYASNI